MLKVAKIERSGSSATVVVESTNPDLAAAIEEASSAEARRLALEEAVRVGIAQPAINGIVHSPYAVDDAGEVVTDPTRQKIAAYRADIPILARF